MGRILLMGLMEIIQVTQKVKKYLGIWLKKKNS